jgi:hypothetical protein
LCDHHGVGDGHRSRDHHGVGDGRRLCDHHGVGDGQGGSTVGPACRGRWH